MWSINRDWLTLNPEKSDLVWTPLTPFTPLTAMLCRLSRDVIARGLEADERTKDLVAEGRAEGKEPTISLTNRGLLSMAAVRTSPRAAAPVSLALGVQRQDVSKP